MKKICSLIAAAILLGAVATACSDDDDDVVTCSCTVTVSGYSETVEAEAQRGDCNSISVQSLVDQGLLPAEYANMVTIDCHAR